MFDLPLSLARYFLDATGRLDHRALLCTPDVELVAIARHMPPGERAELVRRLRGLRLSWLQQTLAQAAGIDVAVQRRRFLRVLAEAECATLPAGSGHDYLIGLPGSGARCYEQASAP
jgi:hypothetical protein